MKKIFVAATAAVVAGTVLFIACKKDPENSFLGSKKQQRMMGSTGVSSLQEYENYTPAETIIEERLLLINNGVNNPDATMPNIELKEAVWFLEAYFNIGVCQKQKYSVEYVEKERTYYIEIPYSTSGGEILLDGAALLTQYRNLLARIVTNICPEYAINHGDVYVQSVMANSVVLGIEIMYGPKGTTVVEDYLMWGFNKIISPTFSPVHYPGDTNDTYTYNVNDLFTLTGNEATYCGRYVQEEGMFATSNQACTTFIPTGITDAPCNETWSTTHTLSEGIRINKPYYTNGNIVNGQVTVTVNDIKSWGSNYRDYIYNECPVLFNEWKNKPDNANYLNHEFFLAKCGISKREGWDQVFHSPVGIKSICRWMHECAWMPSLKYEGPLPEMFQ